MNKKTINKSKKKNINVINRKGFTLIELLATIAVLSLVTTIVVFTAVSIIDGTKHKTYDVTINNIEKYTSSYILEEGNSINWLNGVTNDYQYQCVTVQRLIDTGFFTGDILDSYISKNKTVDVSDYVYVERDTKTKTLTQNILLVNDRVDSYAGLCSDIVAGAYIGFSVEPDGWSLDKEIAINYNIYNNLDNVSNYKYNYKFDEIELEKQFNKQKMIEDVIVEDNGTLVANIKDKKDNIIITNTLLVNRIDHNGPRVELVVPEGDTYLKQQLANIKIIDNESGFSKGIYNIKYGWANSIVTCDTLTNNTMLKIDEDNINSGSVSITVGSGDGIGKLYVCAKELKDSLGNEINNYFLMEDAYLDNSGPIIRLNNPINKTVRGNVTISLVVNDNYSSVDGSSFVTNDLKVYIGNNLLDNGYELRKIDNNNYELSIENYSYAGEARIIIENNKVLDLLGNGNVRTEISTGITFDNTYTIKYNANGGSGSMVNTVCIYGSNCTISNNTYSKTGYTFAGWTTNADGSDDEYNWTDWSGNWTYVNTYGVKDGVLQLYARWRINKVSIKYSMNGDSITSTTTADDGTVYNWSTNPDKIIKLNDNIFVKNINYGNTISSSGLANYNNSNAMNIIKSGYHGKSDAEWICISDNCKDKTYDHSVNTYQHSDFCDASNGDCEVILEVNWQANTYTINYNANGGSGTTTSSSHTYDTAKTLTVNGFIRPGYTFTGWNTKANGTGTSYSDKASVKNLTSTNGGTVTLYAQWEANTYTINYYMGNGVSTGGFTKIGSSTCRYGVSCNLTSWASLGKTFPGSTYQWNFVGWNTAGASGDDVTSRDYDDSETFNYSFTDDINLYAVGKRTFYFYSGKAPTAAVSTQVQYWNPYSTSANYLTNITVPSATPISSWTFRGYRATDDATRTVTIDTTGTYKPDATDFTSLYFRSIYQRTLTLNYNANGGTGTTASTSQIQYYNSGRADGNGKNVGANVSKPTFALASNGFSKTGHTFSKWALESTDGTKYSAGDSYNDFSPGVSSTTVTKNMYAIWTPYKVSIKYRMNGDSITSQTTADDGTVYNWSTNSNKIIKLNGNIFVKNINYGNTIGSSGLANYNNSKAMNITKSGYHGKSDAEWICVSDNCKDITYDHSANNYQHSDFCDASNGDCEVVLEVNWEPNTYTINYNNGTATSGTLPNQQDATYNSNVQLGTNSMSKSNTNSSTKITFNYNGSGQSNTEKYVKISYTANGWTKTSGSTTRDFTNNYSFTYTRAGNLTLYPCFSETRVSPSFPTPTRDGYTFEGWYTAASGGTRVTSYTDNTNVTLYAHWKLNYIEVSTRNEWHIWTVPRYLWDDRDGDGQYGVEYWGESSKSEYSSESSWSSYAKKYYLGHWNSGTKVYVCVDSNNKICDEIKISYANAGDGYKLSFIKIWIQKKDIDAYSLYYGCLKGEILENNKFGGPCEGNTTKTINGVEYISAWVPKYNKPDGGYSLQIQSYDPASNH